MFGWKLTEELKKNFLENFKKDQKLHIRAWKLFNWIEFFENGKSCLEKDETIEELENSDKNTTLSKVAKFLFDQSPEIIEEIIKNEYDLKKNLKGTKIQNFENNDGLEIKSIKSYIDTSLLEKIDSGKLDSIYNFSGNKNTKIGDIDYSLGNYKKNDEEIGMDKIPEDLLEKSKIFLEAKKNFICHRKKLISDLQDFHKEWSGKDFVLELIDTAGEIGSEIAKPKILEEKKNALIELASNSLKLISIKVKNFKESKNSKKVDFFLKDNEESLKLLDECFNELHDLVIKYEFNILKLKKNSEGRAKHFEEKYLVYEVLNDVTWQGKIDLKLEDINKIIFKLNKNLDILEKEIDDNHDIIKK